MTTAYAGEPVAAPVAGRFDGKFVLITGGSSGIGLAAARRIVAEGGTVFITGRTRAPWTLQRPRSAPRPTPSGATRPSPPTGTSSSPSSGR